MYNECHPFDDECLMGKRVAELGSRLLCEDVNDDWRHYHIAESKLQENKNE